MPLIHSKSPKAFKANAGTLMHEVGKSPHVQSREQALAIAYSTARRAGGKYAAGGMAGPSWTERASARALTHEGAIHSPVPGRTDQLPISVKGGAYVLPADHVSALGQNNTTAGTDVLNRMMKLGPYGAGSSPLHGIRQTTPKLNLSAKPPKFAAGGSSTPTPIICAGGEYVVPPEKVREIGGGDIEKGHRILDHWVLATRKKHVKILRKLKPPKAS